jgi:putative transposase
MTSHDPDFWEKAADVCGLYLNPPSNAVVWSVDENSGRQAKSRINPTKPAVFLAGVTAHPIGTWVTQQARNFAARIEDEDRVIKFLIRDRDSKFVGPFDEVMRSIGARVIKTPVRAPRANAFAERFVRTARTECLDWLLIRSERHLERVLAEFVQHYNVARPHRGIDLEVPIPYLSRKQFDGSAQVQRIDQLGGLLHEYRIAA